MKIVPYYLYLRPLQLFISSIHSIYTSRMMLVLCKPCYSVILRPSFRYYHVFRHFDTVSGLVIFYYKNLAVKLRNSLPNYRVNNSDAAPSYQFIMLLRHDVTLIAYRWVCCRPTISSQRIRWASALTTRWRQKWQQAEIASCRPD